MRILSDSGIWLTTNPSRTGSVHMVVPFVADIQALLVWQPCVQNNRELNASSAHRKNQILNFLGSLAQ